MRYLENPVCEFKEAPPGATRAPPRKPSGRTDIVSLSLFRMANGGYKPFGKYLSGLKLLDRWAKGKGMEVRLFAETPLVREPGVARVLSGLSNTRAFLYDCPSHGVWGAHGLFGTMVRFFPMFDFPGNDAGAVMVLDADVKLESLDDLDRRWEALVKPYEGLAGGTRIRSRSNGSGGASLPMVVYRGNYRHVNSQEGAELAYCVADSIVGVRRVSRAVLLDFLESLEGSVARGSAMRLTQYADKGERKCDAGLCFGIDEYFINTVFLPELVRRRAKFSFHFHHIGIDAFYLAYKPEEKNPDKAPFRGAVMACLREMYPPDGMDYSEVDRRMWTDVDEASATTDPFIDDFMRRLHEQWSRMVVRGDGSAVPWLKDCLAKDRAAGCEYYAYEAIKEFPGGVVRVSRGLRYGTKPCRPPSRTYPRIFFG